MDDFITLTGWAVEDEDDAEFDSEFDETVTFWSTFSGVKVFVSFVCFGLLVLVVFVWFGTGFSFITGAFCDVTVAFADPAAEALAVADPVLLVAVAVVVLVVVTAAALSFLFPWLEDEDEDEDLEDDDEFELNPSCTFGIDIKWFCFTLIWIE